MNEVKDRALELIRLRAEGLASEAETRELESLLRANPELVDLHVEYLLLDDTLVNRAREIEGAIAQQNDSIAMTPPRKSPKRAFAALTLTAVAVVLLGLGLFLWPDEAGPVQATVISADNVVLRDQVDGLEAGMSIALGRIDLKSGRLEVELESGVRLEMIAPFDGMLLDSMQLHLASGRLNADVGPRGHGFTVRTDAGDVVDLGTRFGIEADADGECRVAVFSGEVELRPRRAAGASDESPNVRLTEGQAARFSALAGLRQWREVAMAAKADGISSQPYAGVVATIQDNLGNKKLHPFYGLVQGGMREGALAYTDKPRPAWLPLEGEEFPAFLEGADLIRTYHQFRCKRNYRLRLHLRDPAQIFVLRDVREEAPDWLKSEFEDTGVRLRVGPWNPAVSDKPGVLIQAGEPYLIAAVWRRTADTGVIELGSTRATDDDTLTIMYGLAVKRLSDQPSR